MGNGRWKWIQIPGGHQGKSLVLETWNLGLGAFFLFFFSFLFFPSTAQYSFTRWDSIPVKISNILLLNPWAGGLNFPQFSIIDLDGNGINDLFVFDRSGLGGNKILTFLNKNIPDSAAFIHQPQFQKKFPPLQGWALLCDYNNDSKQDIFTSNPKGGIMVFKNEFSLPDSLTFLLKDSLLKANFGVNQLEIYVSPWDIPAVTDIDNDGDIDILSFNPGGMNITYYKNTSIENFGSPDSLIFEVGDPCWGKFEEAFSNCNISLGVSCKGNPEIANVIQNGAKHAGSTLLALDLDADNDKELLVGDLICNYLTQLTNGGDIFSANMIESNKQYPPDFPVKITQFPGAFYLDVDNDNIKDLLSAPSAINISENFTSAWFYKNTGSNSLPQFEFRTSSFLQNTMIETGEGANVAFFDANGDSLQDIIIGNSGYYKSLPYLSELSFYKNTGTKTNPSYELVTRDYAGLSTLGLTDIHPCFGDIDGDKDLDMIIGEEGGELFLFKNSGEPGDSAVFSLTSPGYKGIDVGLFSAPQLTDVNRDGKPDLLIGEKNGNLNYYENTGTAENAEFTLVTDSFGKINIREPGTVTGYSVPCLADLDTALKYSLLVGTESGKIYLFQNIDGNLEGSFSLIDTMFSGIWEGIRSSIKATDLNNDGNPEIMVGNYCGGTVIYKNNALPKEQKFTGDTFLLKLFPNPASGNFYINIPEIKSSADFFLFNILGEIVLHHKIYSKGKYFINSKNFVAGVYYCKLIVDGSILFKEKIVFVK